LVGLLWRLGCFVEDVFWQSRYWLADSFWNLKKFLWQPGIFAVVLIASFITWSSFRPSPSELGGQTVFELACIWWGIAVALFCFGWVMYGEGWPSLSYTKPKVPAPPEPEIDEFPSPDEVDEFVRKLPLKK